jgi:hypothetical protein
MNRYRLEATGGKELGFFTAQHENCVFRKAATNGREDLLQ